MLSVCPGWCGVVRLELDRLCTHGWAGGAAGIAATEGEDGWGGWEAPT